MAALGGCSYFWGHPGTDAHEVVERPAVVKSVRTVYLDPAQAKRLSSVTRSPEIEPRASSAADKAAVEAAQRAAAMAAAAVPRAPAPSPEIAVDAGEHAVPASEITVRLDDGELRAVVQEGGGSFVAGQKVKLVSQGGEVRVTP